MQICAHTNAYTFNMFFFLFYKIVTLQLLLFLSFQADVKTLEDELNNISDKDLG